MADPRKSKDAETTPGAGEAPKAATGNMITIDQAAKLFECTPRWVRELCLQGYIPKAVKGKIPLVAGVQGILRYMRDDNRKSSKSAAASRVQDARSVEIELRTAERRRDLISYEEVVEIVSGVAAATKAELMGIAPRITRDLAQREVIQKEVDDVLRRVAGLVAPALRSAKTGVDAADAVGGDDT